MKFTDGYWLKKPGVQLYGCTDVYDVLKEENRVTLTVLPFELKQRGQLLEGPALTVEITSPLADILAVRVTHFSGGLDNEPKFELRDERMTLSIDETEDVLAVSSGKLTARVRRRPFSIEYLFDGRVLTASETGRLAYAETPQGAFIREQLNIGVGEQIYGLGERFTPFIKNGQAVDIWNEDGGTSSEISYKNVPFYLSSRGYGVLVNSSGKVSYEIGSEAVSKAQFSLPGESMQYMIIGGDSRRDALANYTALSGRPALPPAWSFGLWLSTSFTTSYDEKTVHSFVDGMLDRGIPLHVFHFDCFWMKGHEWCNFLWDDRLFPDPKAMLGRLKAKGLRVCVWINPYIGQKSCLFEEGKKNGYLLKRPDGGVWQWDRWQPGLAVVDFTNPAARAWYTAKLKALMDMGVDCFKTDFGERIPTNVVYYDGSDPERMHNYYTYLYNKVVFDLLIQERGEGEACLFARSATVGGQKFPVHWGGDCYSDFPSMAESLRGGLSLTTSGFGFWSHDISGFEATATPDVYKRWSAFGLLSTHSRLHGSSSYRVPWLFDEEAVDVVRHFTRLKCRLMPYLYAAACEAHESGIPVMRAMMLEFDDPACLPLDRQYMLGGALMVAPIFREDSVAEYYLPAGKWTHLLSGETKEGGRWFTQPYDYFSLPLYVRENTLLPMGGSDSAVDYDYGENLTIQVFALTGRAHTAVRDRDGKPLLDVSAVYEDGRVTLTKRGKSSHLSYLLRGVDAVRGLTGAKAQETPLGTLLTDVEDAVSLSI